MKNLLLFAIFSILLSTNLSAQQITFSNSVHEDNIDNFVLGKSDNAIYVITSHYSKGDERYHNKTIEQLDNNLKILKTYPFDNFEKSGMGLIKSFVAKNELNLLCYDLRSWVNEKDKSKRGLFIRVFQPFTNKTITIDTMPISTNIDLIGIRFSLKSDGDNCVLYMDYQTNSLWVKNSKDLTYWSIDDHFNFKKHTVTLNIPDLGKKDGSIGTTYKIAGNYFIAAHFLRKKQSKIVVSIGDPNPQNFVIEKIFIDCIDINTNKLYSIDAGY